MERERQDGDPIPRASRRARGEISARFETHRYTKRRKNSGILSYFTSPRIARLVGAIYSMDKQEAYNGEGVSSILASNLVIMKVSGMEFLAKEA